MFRYSSEVFRTPINNEVESKPSTSKENAYKCELCGKWWPSDTELYYHKKGHSKRIIKYVKEGAQFCWTCIKLFKTSEQLLEHFKQCHLLTSKKSRRVEREMFICDECNNIFFNKSILKIHIMHCHLKGEFRTKKKVNCPLCNKLLFAKYIWGHFHVHNVSGPRTCSICLKKNANWNDHEKHLKVHPLDLHCNICNIRFDKSCDYTSHLESHSSKVCVVDGDTGIVKKIFIPKQKSTKKVLFGKLLPYYGLKLQNDWTICILCREICITVEEQIKHIKSYHSHTNHTKSTIEEIKKVEAPKFVCSCGEIFIHRILLKQHITRKKGSESSHEELSERDIEHLISEENCTVIEVINS